MAGHEPLERRRRLRGAAAVLAGFVVGVVPVTSTVAATTGEGVFNPTGACAIDACASERPEPVGAAVLQNGKVLMARMGQNAASELYDPATGSWATTGACAGCGSGNFSLTLTTLQSGKVLVAGGLPILNAIADPTANAFLYDPATGTWSQTGSMTVPRMNHSATLLGDGRVLVAGGCTTSDHGCGPSGGNPTNSAEIYDPNTGTWTATGKMPAKLALQTATLLIGSTCGDRCGKVLVAGGVNLASAQIGAQLFDPVTGTWALARAMGAPHRLHTASLLADGRVFIVGKHQADDESRGELYDPSAGTWKFTSAPPHAVIEDGTAAALPNGKALVWSGTPQLYDPVADTWSDFPSEATRARHVEMLLPPGPASACATNCGKVLLAGGATSTAELYTPPPAVTGATPSSGAMAGGTTITIRGSGFASATGVMFGGVAATSFALDPTTPDSLMTAVTPSHAAGAADIIVTGPAGSSTGGGGAVYSFQAPATTTSTSTSTSTTSTTTTTTSPAPAAAGSPAAASTPAPSATATPVPTGQTPVATPVSARLALTG